MVCASVLFLIPRRSSGADIGGWRGMRKICQVAPITGSQFGFGLRSSVFGFRGLRLAGNEPKICPVAPILRSQFGFGFRSSVFGFRVFVFFSAPKLWSRFLEGSSRCRLRSSVFGFRLRGGPPDIVFSVFGFRFSASVFGLRAAPWAFTRSPLEA